MQLPNLAFDEEYWDASKEPSPFPHQLNLSIHHPRTIGILEKITALNFLKTMRIERNLKSHYHTKL